MVELAYGLYLLISIGMTVWVAHTLSSNGEVFLVQCFGHNAEVAKSTNHLLVVGFYLVNIGFITLTLSNGLTFAAGNLLFDIGTTIGAAGLLLTFVVSAISNTRKLYVAEPLPRENRQPSVVSHQLADLRIHP